MKITPLENWILRKAGMTERTREQLEDYQLHQLRESVRQVKTNSRFYGDLLRDISAEEIRSLDDMRRLPFTFPRDIRKDPFSFLCVPQNQIKRIVTLRSTGTSGKEKRIFFSEEDLNLTIDFFVYGMRCLVDETNRVMVLLPGGSYGSIGDLLKKALEKAHIDCFVHGVITDYEETAREILKTNSTCLVGIPIQVLKLSRIHREVFKSRIKKVLLSTDYVPEVLIRELTDQCGCRVFTHYGMTEMGYGGGVECEALNGYHMREADLYFEIVDPATGEPVPDGQWGEVVFTTLTRQAMPLIRYRTGDMAAFSAVSCPCGTILRTMKRVQGRLDNKIVIRDRCIYLKELDEIVLSYPEITDFKAFLSKEGCLNLEIAAVNDEAYQSIKNEIAGRIQKYEETSFGRGSDLPVRVSRKIGTGQITNSMSKRTITDSDLKTVDE